MLGASRARRARFNLLLLDEGEYHLDEYMGVRGTMPPPLPLDDETRHRRLARRCEGGGRVVVTSGAIFFDPDDIREPVVRYSFRHMPQPPAILSPPGARGAAAAEDAKSAPLLVFSCALATECLALGETKPYEERSLAPGVSSAPAPSEDAAPGVDPAYAAVALHMPHTSVGDVQRMVQQLWRLDAAGRKSGLGLGDRRRLLAPFLVDRWRGAFDLTCLASVAERPVPSSDPGAPFLLERVCPLVTFPGRALVTESALYVQPVRLNNPEASRDALSEQHSFASGPPPPLSSAMPPPLSSGSSSLLLPLGPPPLSPLPLPSPSLLPPGPPAPPSPAPAASAAAASASASSSASSAAMGEALPPGVEVRSQGVLRLAIANVGRVARRRRLLRDTSLEIFPKRAGGVPGAEPRGVYLDLGSERTRVRFLVALYEAATAARNASLVRHLVEELGLVVVARDGSPPHVPTLASLRQGPPRDLQPSVPGVSDADDDADAPAGGGAAPAGAAGAGAAGAGAATPAASGVSSIVGLIASAFSTTGGGSATPSTPTATGAGAGAAGGGSADERRARRAARTACAVSGVAALTPGEVRRLLDACGAWQEGALSNLDYLLVLNDVSGRSFNDISQYPVVPWVLADYASAELDLRSPATFRDLTRPVGALRAERLASLRARLDAMRDEPVTTPEAAPFLFGTHYSAPGYVLFFLVRQMARHMLRLQHGRFDRPDRLFWSVPGAWDGVQTNPADVKELIPEFYASDGAFLVCPQGLDLGTRSDGVRVGDVQLPPWARGDPQAFVRLHRQALESPIVSAALPRWIDLIFGVAQRGPAADAANNLFHPLSYEGPAEAALAMATVLGDANRRDMVETHAAEFGQTPRQLFLVPHPAKAGPRLPRELSALWGGGGGGAGGPPPAGSAAPGSTGGGGAGAGAGAGGAGASGPAAAGSGKAAAGGAGATSPDKGSKRDGTNEGGIAAGGERKSVRAAAAELDKKAKRATDDDKAPPKDDTDREEHDKKTAAPAEKKSVTFAEPQDDEGGEAAVGATTVAATTTAPTATPATPAPTAAAPPLASVPKPSAESAAAAVTATPAAETPAVAAAMPKPASEGAAAAPPAKEETAAAKEDAGADGVDWGAVKTPLTAHEYASAVRAVRVPWRALDVAVPLSALMTPLRHATLARRLAQEGGAASAVELARLEAEEELEEEEEEGELPAGAEEEEEDVEEEEDEEVVVAEEEKAEEREREGEGEGAARRVRRRAKEALYEWQASDSDDDELFRSVLGDDTPLEPTALDESTADQEADAKTRRRRRRRRRTALRRAQRVMRASLQLATEDGPTPSSLASSPATWMHASLAHRADARPAGAEARRRAERRGRGAAGPVFPSVPRDPPTGHSRRLHLGRVVAVLALDAGGGGEGDAGGVPPVVVTIGVDGRIVVLGPAASAGAGLRVLGVTTVPSAPLTAAAAVPVTWGCVAVGTAAGSVGIVDVTRGVVLASVAKAHTGAVRCLAVSRDGRSVVSGGDDGLVASWRCEWHQPVAQWTWAASATSAALHPTPVSVVREHAPHAVTALALSGLRLASGDASGVLVLAELVPDTSALLPLVAHEALASPPPMEDVDADADGDGDGDGDARASSGSPSSASPDAREAGAPPSPDGGGAVTDDELASETVPTQLRLHGVTALAWGWSHVVAATADGRVALFSDDGDLRGTVVLGEAIVAMASLARGAIVAVGGSEGSVRLLSLRTLLPALDPPATAGAGAGAGAGALERKASASSFQQQQVLVAKAEGPGGVLSDVYVGDSLVLKSISHAVDTTSTTPSGGDARDPDADLLPQDPNERLRDAAAHAPWGPGMDNWVAALFVTPDERSILVGSLSGGFAMWNRPFA